MAFDRVLIVCYGNIFRSPLAAAILRRELAGIAACEIRSAGFHDPGGRRTPVDFVTLVQDRAGIDLAPHRSQVVSSQDVAWADTVLIMDRLNWYRLAQIDECAAEKMIWLGAFGSDESCEIPDPYGQSPQVMAAIIDRLETTTAGLVGHLLALRGLAPDPRSR